VPHALITGGTGAIGFATARRLCAAGWSVAVTGRSAAHFPEPLAELGVRFTVCDRDDSARLRAVAAGGADLLVDCACKTAAQAHDVAELLGSFGSTVLISSRAVYVDAQGRHLNSDEPPSFDGPIGESQPTLRPDGSAAGTREGYGPNKVAAERVLLDCGYPVSVLRASKVHGSWSRRPREWVFVKRALDRRRHLFLAGNGRGGDHCTAAVNIAALVEVVAGQPSRRVLNVADPDVPTALDIAHLVASHLGHSWEEMLIEGDGPGEAAVGRTPWDLCPPVVLDTSAALELGYRPVGGYAETVIEELDWLATQYRDRRAGWPLPAVDDPFFAPLMNYAAEDSLLALWASQPGGGDGFKRPSP
jgi:nucleoside-diphosphate-sugar epimerase